MPYTTAGATQSATPSARLYVAPASTAPVHYFLYPVDDGFPHVDVNNPPVPTQCCDACSGTGSRALYTDVARTMPAVCDAFFLQYAINEGWVCQFYGDGATAAVAGGGTPSIAYLPT